jgi:hypothetical protein
MPGGIKMWGKAECAVSLVAQSRTWPSRFVRDAELRGEGRDGLELEQV